MQKCALGIRFREIGFGSGEQCLVDDGINEIIDNFQSTIV